MSSINIQQFQKIIWDHYRAHGRFFDWRHTDDPYKIFISEVMLQQTQTSRVAQKYPIFMQAFPNFWALAHASLKEVLLQWQGLGYNRRGMFLHQSAQKIVSDYNGILPDDPNVLIALPGIGKATAASMIAFAYNKPTVFIETNIRSVFIHFFFATQTEIADSQIMPLIQASLDLENPRDWYYALMDYGVYLKKLVVNPNKKSKHYTKQSKFQGSDRQIRGMILKILSTNAQRISQKEITDMIGKDHVRIEKIIKQLIKEKFISQFGGLIGI